GDAVGERVASSFAARAFDERSLAFVEQNSGRTAVGGIGRIHIDRYQPAAANKRGGPDLVDAGRDGDAGHAGFVVKRPGPDASHGLAANGRRDWHTAAAASV